jgi:hypothetical protein
MARVIRHARHALDHQGDARQGPEPGPEPMRAGAFAQGDVDAGQLLWRQSRLAPRSAGGAQRLAATRPPCPIPPHHALATDSQAPRNRALRLATGGEQPRGLLPTNFQPVEIPSWGHMSGHASIVRCGRPSIVTILRETQ